MTLREVLRQHGLTEADLLDAQVGGGQTMSRRLHVDVSFSVYPGGHDLTITAEAWVPVKEDAGGLVCAADSPFRDPGAED